MSGREVEMEKVVKGLECHRIDNNHRINCADCPYYVDDDNYMRCVNDLHDDALAILQEQEAVVRCKDCEYVCMVASMEMFPDIPFYAKCMLTEETHEPSWFCADGERRTDDA